MLVLVVYYEKPWVSVNPPPPRSRRRNANGHYLSQGKRREGSRIDRRITNLVKTNTTKNKLQKREPLIGPLNWLPI